MLRLATDADVNGDIIDGLRRRLPELDLVRVQEVNLRLANDPTILEWAAQEGRILITADRSTMVDSAWERVANGLAMPGVFALRRWAAVGRVIEDLELALECSLPEDWKDRVEYFPL
jgi:hypothetical protein